MTEPRWQAINRPGNVPGAPQVYWRQFPDGRQESLTEDHPRFQDWLAEGNTPAPAEAVDPWQAIREKRDALIRESDWTMIPGCTVDQAQWAAYRQTLRDIPATYAETGPESVVWPRKPSTSGPNTIDE